MTGTDAEIFAPLGEAAQSYRVLDSRLLPSA
jgi:hypothetical protein